MFISFFESLSYTGHLLPVAFIRIYFGYLFLSSGAAKFMGDYFLQPILAGQIGEWLPKSSAPLWYQLFIDSVVISNWQFFAYGLAFIEVILGLSLIFGFFVRPMALIGLFLCLNLMWISSPIEAHSYQIQIFVLIALFWIGAGRTLGVDYYYFKRRRGLWW